MKGFLHGEVSCQIIGAAFEVWRVLGYGFLEKVYENALAEELRKSGLEVQQQAEVEVRYKGVAVGRYITDLLVEKKVIAEIKVEEEYNPRHEAHVLNYLKATGIRVGLLLSIGKRKCTHKRLVL